MEGGRHTILISPRNNTLPFQVLQQWRKDPPTLLHLIGPDVPRKISPERVQQEHFVRLGDLPGTVIIEIEIVGFGFDADVEVWDEGIDGKEDSFVRLDADGHFIGRHVVVIVGGEDVGVGCGVEIYGY